MKTSEKFIKDSHHNNKNKYTKCSKCKKECVTVTPNLFDGMCADCTDKYLNS